MHRRNINNPATRQLELESAITLHPHISDTLPSYMFQNSFIPASPSNKTTTMKAAQYFGPHDIRVVSTPTPVPQAHEALIAVSYAGICGSDLHEYLHGPFSCPPASRPHPLTNQSIPVTLGHEFVGRIVSAPSSFSKLQEGTPIIVDPRLYCRACKKCNDGFTHGCEVLGFKGLSGGGGGFAEKVCVDARQVYVLPNHVNMAEAALIEPLAVAWHAIKTTGIEDWRARSALVIGGGPVGIAVMIVLRAFGCNNIVVSEPTRVRARQSKSVADVVLNPLEEDIGTRCREMTAGEGVDVVFDCAGNQKGFEAGMDAVRYRGIYMNVAAWFGTPVCAHNINFFHRNTDLPSVDADTIFPVLAQRSYDQVLSGIHRRRVQGCGRRFRCG